MPTNRTSPTKRPVILIILDGWGVAPATIGNAVAHAKTPNFDKYVKLYPTQTIQASGEAVGLPFGAPGNSEVGHMNLGAGRIIYQNLPKITQAIWSGDFFTNSAFIGVCDYVKKNNSKLHLLGLVSSGGVHSYLEHLLALLELAKKERVSKVYIHAFLDGRDTEYNSGLGFISQLQEKLENLGIGKIATIAGRYYALDRDNHWERIEKVYLAMTQGVSLKKFNAPTKAIEDSYASKIYDEEFVPVVITQDGGDPVALVKDGDGLIFFNFRGDRSRELAKVFVRPSFKEFSRPQFLENLFFVTMTEYEEGLPVKVAFPPDKIDYPMSRILSEAGMAQLHIAETEKYAHVTFFFAGGQEKVFEGQENFLVPSPRIPSYADKPEMSASEVTQKVIQAIKSQKFNFIIINYANPDMVGHTGDFGAGIKAVEYVDNCLGQIIESILNEDGVAIITADHGNVEEMINLQTGEIDKEHSINPVPFIIIGRQFEGQGQGSIVDLSVLTPAGVLADVAPTILKILGLEKHKDMTGRALV